MASERNKHGGNNTSLKLCQQPECAFYLHSSCFSHVVWSSLKWFGQDVAYCHSHPLVEQEINTCRLVIFCTNVSPTNSIHSFVLWIQPGTRTENTALRQQLEPNLCVVKTKINHRSYTVKTKLQQYLWPKKDLMTFLPYQVEYRPYAITYHSFFQVEYSCSWWTNVKFDFHNTVDF